MISHQPAAIGANPIEKMGSALQTFLSTTKFSNIQENTLHLWKEIQVCDLEIQQYIAEDKIDPYLTTSFFAFIGYFGLQQTLIKLHEKNKLSSAHISTALAYAVTEHDFPTSITKDEKEFKLKGHLSKFLYTHLDDTPAGKMPKKRHQRLDKSLEKVRKETRAYLMPMYIVLLEKEECSVQEFANDTLSVVNKNYDVEFLKAILLNEKMPSCYRALFISAMTQGLVQGVQSQWRLLFFLYCEAGGNIDLTVSYTAKYNDENTKKIIMAKFHLLHIIVLLNEPHLYFMLVPRLKNLTTIPAIEEIKQATVISNLEPLYIKDLGMTILHTAAYVELIDVVEDILQRQLVDVNAKTQSGLTALMISADSDNLDQTKKLLWKANPSLITPKGNAAWSNTEDPDIIMCLAKAFCEWEQKRAKIIKKVQEGEAKNGKVLSKNQSQTKFKVDNFPIINAELELFRLFNEVSHFYFKALQNPEMYMINQKNNASLSHTLDVLEDAKKKVGEDEFHDHILKLVDRVAPYLGFFGCQQKYIKRLLNVVNKDIQIVSALTTYAVPNRSQEAITKGLDRFIDQSEILEDQYLHLINKHTRLNKLLIDPRKALRNYLFERVKSFIHQGISKSEFNYLMEGCANQRDREFLRHIVVEMMQVKTPGLLVKEYFSLLKNGPTVGKDENDGEDEKSFVEHVTKFYFSEMQSTISQLKLKEEDLSDNASEEESEEESEEASEEELEEKSEEESEEIESKSNKSSPPESKQSSNPSVEPNTEEFLTLYSRAQSVASTLSPVSDEKLSIESNDEYISEMESPFGDPIEEERNVPVSSTQCILETMQLCAEEEKNSDKEILSQQETNVTSMLNSIFDSDSFDARYKQKSILKIQMYERNRELINLLSVLAHAHKNYMRMPTKQNLVAWNVMFNYYKQQYNAQYQDSVDNLRIEQYSALSYQNFFQMQKTGSSSSKQTNIKDSYSEFFKKL